MDIYQRNVYSVTQLLSDVGGIYNSLFLFGLVLCAIPTSNLFYAKIIKEIY